MEVTEGATGFRSKGSSEGCLNDSLERSSSVASSSPTDKTVFMSVATSASEEDVILEAKWGGKLVRLSFTSTDFDTFTFLDMKSKIESELDIPMSKQKLLGIVGSNGSGYPQDKELLSDIVFKRHKSFMLIGTPNSQALDEEANSGANVINDLAWDYVPPLNSAIELRTSAHLRRLQRAISKTEVRLINKPRQGRKLLVLDLDYTLFDCKGATHGTIVLDERKMDMIVRRVGNNSGSTGGTSPPTDSTPISNSPSITTKLSSQSALVPPSLAQPYSNLLSSIEDMKRPYLEHFMEKVYENYDIAIWSQTNWQWVEMKCTELGFLTSEKFNICFVLDRSSMFTVKSGTKGKGMSHEVKALEVIWAKFPDVWGPHNTLHVDDLSRNFAMNPNNGVKVSSYKAHKRMTDNELLHLTAYLSSVSSATDVSAIDHSQWKKKFK